jgi:4-aminobutyrate aminotransferase-like enzyme
MWGHQLLGVTPDIAVLGKPMGNGYPVAGLVARPPVLAAFREAFGYFNTFAASPVAAAAATAVLDVMEQEGLMENAARVGARMAAGLSALDHPAIARVTAHGLLFAVELTEANGTTPAPALAEEVVERMKDAGVLIGRIGREMHILKLRPPMCFGPGHADRAVAALAAALDDAVAEAGQPA